MPTIVTLSFAASTILLSICVWIYAFAAQASEKSIRGWIVGLGLIPGLIGVVYGFSLAFTGPGSRIALPVMSAWLLLELAALRLSQIVKRYDLVPREKKPD